MASGGDATRVTVLDLADPAQAFRLWQEISAHERIDVLVNNAGVFPDHPPLTTECSTRRPA